MIRSYLALFAVLSVVPAAMAETNSTKDSSDNSMQMKSQNMQETMLRMHEQMHKIMQTKDGVTRERLIQEHRNMIDEQMRMMHSMIGNCMEGSSSSHK